MTGLLLLTFGCAAAVITPTTEPNMNGEYMLSPTPNAPNPTFSTNFKDYPGGVESFTLYAGPITSTYAEVFWKALPEVKLPDDIIQRFKGKGMAIIGFEADQVRKGAGPVERAGQGGRPTGVAPHVARRRCTPRIGKETPRHRILWNCCRPTGEDVSVPINVA